MGKLAAMGAAALAMSAALIMNANADDFPAAYDNTVIVTTGDESQFRYFFEPDGTFSAILPDATTMSGRYTIDEEQICFIQGEDQPQCAPFVAGKQLGDAWEQTGIDGAPITVTIVEGR
jgi:hypothetical protein